MKCKLYLKKCFAGSTGILCWSDLDRQCKPGMFNMWPTYGFYAAHCLLKFFQLHFLNRVKFHVTAAIVTYRETK